MNMRLRKQIASRLDAAMKASQNLSTQQKLEKKSGVAQATIGRMLRCESDARVDTLLSIADALGKPLSYFLDLSGDVETAPARPPGRSAPLISEVQASTWHDAAYASHPDETVDWFEVPPRASSKAFWLKVVGDSMTSPAGQSVPEGSLILVDPEVPADNGKLVVAHLTGTDGVAFKKLVIDSGRKFLKPLNPEYPMNEITSNCQIIGVVIESRQCLG